MTNAFEIRVNRKLIEVNIIREKSCCEEVRAIPVNIARTIGFIKKTKRTNIYSTDLLSRDKTNLIIWILGANTIEDAREAVDKILVVHNSMYKLTESEIKRIVKRVSKLPTK